jgi:signal transduction histidine kinase
MAPSDIPTALAQFGRVDNPGGRKFPGIGLGLSTVAAIMELHGGELTLDSELGKGTIASVSIPAERVAADARSGETPQAFTMGSIA